MSKFTPKYLGSLLIYHGLLAVMGITLGRLVQLNLGVTEPMPIMLAIACAIAGAVGGELLAWHKGWY